MLKQLITKSKPYHQLKKFRGQEHLSAHIYMSIFLTSGDINNLLFIQQQRDHINTLITQYSPESPLLPHTNKEDIKILHKIPLYCTLHDDKRLIFEQHSKDPLIQFVYYYFQYFELLQHCIDLANRNHQYQRKTLANTFAFITDDYHNIHSPNKPLRLLVRKYMSLTAMEDQEKGLIQNFFVDAINTILHRYTNFSLTIDQKQVQLFDENGQYCDYHSLSLGEQSFLRLIFLIFSHDLHHGLLIIDEPETHLHPQAQKEFLKLLEELVEKQHIQAIIATHSPSLITINTIHHVFRCTKQQGQTKIYAPHYPHFQSDHSL